MLFLFNLCSSMMAGTQVTRYWFVLKMCLPVCVPILQLAMINIHTRLAQLAASSNTGGCSSGGGGGAGNGVAEDLQLQFRRPRSNPGGGLYKQFDDVRPVLQVRSVFLFMCAIH